ncbi:hypothetical protein AB0I60_05760 [Actinosynnema sp. NPDC050436]|uniref:hypothetical protein n=1 Tax=Actinosynnema sp. NPDC050436 TaxID=3155659 RepID=UPI0033DEE9AB
MSARETPVGTAADMDRLTRIGTADVRRLEAATRELRRADYRDGGGACATARAELARGRRLLRVHVTERLRGRLLVAVADLHNFAGWTAFDGGRPRAAHAHYRVALKLLEQHADQDLVANVCYRSARAHLHRRDPARALRALDRGRIAADRAGSARTSAIISVNQAWARAMRGSPAETLALLRRAGDEFARATDASRPWSAFFDASDLQAMIGIVHTELACSHDVGHTRLAMPALRAALDGYGPSMRRSRVFSLTALALNHLLAGDHVGGALVAARALDSADGLASSRVADRMLPLLRYCERVPAGAGLADTAHRIRALVERTRPPRRS